jgi:hypothetical protein
LEIAMIQNVSIKQVSHDVAAGDPAAFAPALTIARSMHPPLARAPEVATAPVTAARPARRAAARRRTVRG